MSEIPARRIGVVGTGFVARHFTSELRRRTAYRLGRVLTRRPLDRCPDFPQPDALTDSVGQLIETSDVVFECSGDAAHAANVIGQALAAGKPVVTMDAEFHVTLGSAFAPLGLLSEAEGDQPGCQAALAEEARALGFAPIVFGNLKGFLNRNPTSEEMAYWGNRNGISLPMVTSFTDGTKLQIEQALVANGLGATIGRDELLGLETGDIQAGGQQLALAAAEAGQPISDYLLHSTLPHGVFLVATHDAVQKDCLRYLKLGDGPYYTLLRPNIFIHLEVFKTIERLAERGCPLLNNGVRPTVSVATVAKRTLKRGERIRQGIGSFEVRGVCVRMRDYPGHLPIGLASDLHIERRIEPGEVISFDDVDLEDGAAVATWRGIEARALGAAGDQPATSGRNSASRRSSSAPVGSGVPAMAVTPPRSPPGPAAPP